MNKLDQNKYIFGISSELPNLAGQKSVVEPGRAHYSYRSVRDKFCDMLSKAGAPWIDIQHPEIYRSFNLGPTVFGKFNAEKIHISFKPTQYLRTAGGFRNIAHIAWEFDQLRSKYATDPILPSNDDMRMLSAFEQVWVGSNFTRDVLLRHGLKNVFTVPAPISMPDIELMPKTQEILFAQIEQIKKLKIKCFPVSVRNHGFMYAQHSTDKTPKELTRVIQKTITGGGRAFLQILNPHDARKNLKKLIKAFHAFHYKNPNTVLILKFTSPEKNESVYEILRWFLDDSHALDAKGVYFTTDYIPEDKKVDLMTLFDFYVSPARAEGQNLPLQEAMACGVVPISTRHTAMLDYIDDKNSFIIPSTPSEVTHLTTSDKTIWGFEWNDCTEVDIYHSLTEAMRATPEELLAKRVAARSSIGEKYSYTTINSLMANALEKEINAHG